MENMEVMLVMIYDLNYLYKGVQRAVQTHCLTI